MITVLTINWHAPEYLQLLIDSVAKNTAGKELQIMVVDNSRQLVDNQLTAGKYPWTVSQKIGNVQVDILTPSGNFGHGGGIDYALRSDVIKGEHIALMDVDAHILRPEWDRVIKAHFKTDSRVKLIAAEGGKLKPVRPLFMFFELETILQHNISFKAQNHEGVKFDVGIHAYFRLLTEYGDGAVRILPYAKTAYNEVLGSEYTLNGQRFVYHNWYGTRWYNEAGERVHDQIDSVTWEDYERRKASLFKQVAQQL